MYIIYNVKKYPNYLQIITFNHPYETRNWNSFQLLKKYIKTYCTGLQNGRLGHPYNQNINNIITREENNNL